MILLTCNETWQKWCLQAKIGRWRGYERRRSGLCVSIPNDVRQTTAFVSPIDKDRARSKVRWSATTLATLQRSLLISSHLSTPCRPPLPLTIVVKNLFAGTRFPHHINYPPPAPTLSRGLKSFPRWRQPFDSTCLCRQNSALNTRQPTLARGHDERIESGRKHVFAMKGRALFSEPCQLSS